MKESNASGYTYVPILPDRHKMAQYLQNDFCRMVFDIYEEYYEIIRFIEPWTGYFVLEGAVVVGTGGFKGAPGDGKVEIAYGTVPEFEGQGVSTHTCRFLIETALKEDPSVLVTARTLREENASTSILKKNGFVFAGEVIDPEDGLVGEWVYRV